MKWFLKFLFLYDEDDFRNMSPRPGLFLVTVIWIIFCTIMFVQDKDMSFGGKLCFAVISLWIFLRMCFYRGRHRPRFVFVFRILWLPMAVLFFLLSLTGNF